MANAAILKDLTIKTSIVKRLVKEFSFYEKEAEKESAKLNNLKASGDMDDYVVKKQIEVLQDTQQMIPECLRRLTRSIDDLKKATAQYESALKDTPQYVAANKQIAEGVELCSKFNGAQEKDWVY